MSIHQLIQETAGPLDGVEPIVVQDLRNVLLSFGSFVKCAVSENESERINKPPRFWFQLSGFVPATFHGGLVGFDRFQVVGRIAGKPLENCFRFRAVVDPDEQTIFDEVNSLLRLAACLCRHVEDLKLSAADLGRRLGPLVPQIVFQSLQAGHRPASGVR